MSMLLIGNNATALASKTALNQVVGQKIGALLSTLRGVHELKALIDQQGDADLKALGFTDGTSGTANELGYLRTACAVADNLYGISKAVASTQTLPFDHDTPMRYVAATT